MLENSKIPVQIAFIVQNTHFWFWWIPKISSESIFICENRFSAEIRTSSQKSRISAENRFLQIKIDSDEIFGIRQNEKCVFWPREAICTGIFEFSSLTKFLSSKNLNFTTKKAFFRAVQNLIFSKITFRHLTSLRNWIFQIDFFKRKLNVSSIDSSRFQSISRFLAISRSRQSRFLGPILRPRFEAHVIMTQL